MSCGAQPSSRCPISSGVPRQTSHPVQPIELENARHIRFRERPVKEIPLDCVTALRPKKLQLIRSFHPLCHHFQFQTMCHGDYGASNFLVTGVGRNIANERAIYFEGIDWEAL